MTVDEIAKVIDVTWGYALEDGSVPSTDIQNKIIARLNAQVTTTTVKSQDVREALATAQTEITRFRATARQDAEEKARLRLAVELALPIVERHAALAPMLVSKELEAIDAALACRPQQGEKS